MDIISYILSRKYTDNALVGLGALKGANCTIKNIIHKDGINTVTFEWEGTDGTKKTRDMVVYDGTPIYVWESGNLYRYGDLVIYSSAFYRCIVENSDVVFDDTKWNEIGSPDGNYDIVQSKDLLPARFTAADRKLYYVIDESLYYLWNGIRWVGQLNIVQATSLPIASSVYVDRIYQYIGATNSTFTHAYFYECVNSGTTIDPHYQWVNVEVQDISMKQDIFQYDVLPTANADNLGKIYQYTGITNIDYINGYWYKCIFDGTTTPNYRWQVVEVQANPIDTTLDSTSGNPVANSTLTPIINSKLTQYDVMPVASLDNLGQVYQYIGATNANYEHGCFYECISDGAVTPTYSWRNVGFTPMFLGTMEQWNALTTNQKNQYDIVNIVGDDVNIELSIYLRKVQVMPLASDCPSETLMYVGATTADYVRGYIYRSVPTVESGVTVYNWEIQGTQPTYPNVQSDWTQDDSTADDYIKNKPQLGTASAKNFTDNVRPNSHDLVEANAVYNAITNSIASVYKPHGDLTCAELTADLLVAGNIGNIYNMTDSGTTSALFVQGAGKPIVSGNTVGIIQAGDNLIMYNLMGNMIDLHNYQTKELNTPLTIDGVQQTEVEGALGALNTAKADKATTLNGYGITDAYTKTETNTQISNALSNLDVPDSAVNGSYVTSVSEVDGVINVTREAADSVPTDASTKLLTSGGAFTSLSTKLTKINALPTASVLNVGNIYLLTATQAGYVKGGIYECVSDGNPTPTYSWQLISSADMVEFTENELLAMW